MFIIVVVDTQIVQARMRDYYPLQAPFIVRKVCPSCLFGKNDARAPKYEMDIHFVLRRARKKIPNRPPFRFAVRAQENTKWTFISYFGARAGSYQMDGT